MRFDDLARNDDPTRINEQMVVTLDAQLFYSVLSALPYLVNYPYECTEQTLNRFVSTGILVVALPAIPCHRAHGKGVLLAADSVRTVGRLGSQPQDGAGRDALAPDGQRRRHERLRPDQRARRTHRQSAARKGRWPSCASRRLPAADFPGSPAVLRRRT